MYLYHNDTWMPALCIQKWCAHLDTPFYLLVVGSKNNHRMYSFE